MEKKLMQINGKKVSFNGERNLLEVIRKSGIEIPTFCYHSELSVYGACRLCMVDVEGRGTMPSCSIKPEDGLKIRTNTKEIRELRRIVIELLLASHEQNCASCTKSSSCKLKELANKLGVEKVRFQKQEPHYEPDITSNSLVKDLNKCILCGDCVRACHEIQGIGAIDFKSRGAGVTVTTAFDKGLKYSTCVDCGQCARVCPTAAINLKSEIDDVWEKIDDRKKVVVAQIAPAVRAALGESFGMKPGTVITGHIVAALKMMGFDYVYDTSYAADLTIVEEANEFLTRATENKNMPLMTSCCPGWVKFVELNYPEMLPNLSSCKSPQQMFGSIAKDMLPEMFGIAKEDLTVVSIMPCSAKKSEAQRPEFESNGIREVDHVISTKELAEMIKEAGIKLESLEPQSLDLPMGFKTGAGVIFGSSGGVTESVLRYVSNKNENSRIENVEFPETRGSKSLKEITYNLHGKELNIAIVNGLKEARKVIENIKSGNSKYDFIEVMACPGGCIGGAGQPIHYDEDVREERAKGLYNADRMLQLHKSQDNRYIEELYKERLGDIGGEMAHKLLHTKYQTKKFSLIQELNLHTTCKSCNN